MLNRRLSFTYREKYFAREGAENMGLPGCACREWPKVAVAVAPLDWGVFAGAESSFFIRNHSDNKGGLHSDLAQFACDRGRAEIEGFTSDA